jgi:hypothetical protein
VNSLDVMRFERPHEIHLDGDLAGQYRFSYLHSPLASAAIAIPFRDGTLAVCGPAICTTHGRVFSVLGRPAAPIVEVVDEGKNLRRGSERMTANSCFILLRNLARLRGDCAVKHDAPELPFAIGLPFDNPEVLQDHLFNPAARL